MIDEKDLNRILIILCFLVEPVRSDFMEKKNSFESAVRFPPENRPKGKFDFVLSHIESINEFYIQPYSMVDELSELTEMIQKNVDRAPSLKDDQNVCLAKSSDGFWYRAEIIRRDADSKSPVEVRFVDFGDKLIVDPENMRQLEAKLAVLPPCAFKCSVFEYEGNLVESTNVEHNSPVRHTSDSFEYFRETKKIMSLEETKLEHEFFCLKQNKFVSLKKII